jgi:Flp pilus assembly protein TadD
MKRLLTLGAILLIAGSSSQAFQKPPDVKALRMQGLVSYEEGRFADAEKYLTQAARLDPNSFSVRFGLAASLLQQQKSDQALPELEAANKINPAHLDAAKLLAIEYSKRSRNRDAAVILRRLMLTAPEDEELHLLLIEAYHRSGASSESLSVAQQSLLLFPNSARLHYWVGRQSGQQEHLRKAIELDPRYAPAYHSLADILMRDNQNAEAERLLRATLANDRSDVQALIRLGRLLRTQEGLDALRKAATLAPQYSLVHLELSRLYAKLGDKENARKEAEIYRRIRSTAEEKDVDLVQEK